MSFPASPVNGQQIILGNVTYQFNSSKTAWIRVPGLVGANLNVISLTASGNVSAGGYYWANGAPFASSTYANSNVASYLPTDSLITSISSNILVLQGNVVSLQSNTITSQSNIVALQSNAATQEISISGLRANITAANAAIITANSQMKTYVDNQVISSGGYSNVAMTAYLATNDITVANITGGGVRTTSSATPPAIKSVGDIWYSTGEDRIYRYTSDGTTKAWLDITGADYTFDMTGEMSITGNIIPSANVTYSLGTSAYRFKDLYLSGNTIYLGNTSLSESTINSSTNSARYKATIMAMVFGG
jgi:hypothetical protein